jgi:hypothetical protein
LGRLWRSAAADELLYLLLELLHLLLKLLKH